MLTAISNDVVMESLTANNQEQLAMKTWPSFGIRMNTLGFTHQNTGGNCFVYGKALDDERHVIVTDSSGINADGIGPDNWMIGLYDTETGASIAIYQADGGPIDAALRAVGVKL
jgi:hypothetical protein